MFLLMVSFRPYGLLHTYGNIIPCFLAFIRDIILVQRQLQHSYSLNSILGVVLL